MNRLSFIAAMVLCVGATISSAQESVLVSQKNAHGETNEYKISNDGFEWYNDKNITKKDENTTSKDSKAKEKSPASKLDKTNATLEELVKIAKKQLETQEEILKIMQQEFDPQPHTIINEKGEECIANSSADCYEHPVIAEARRIPVLKNWLVKGDMKSSAEWLRWQSKYFKHLEHGAYGLYFAGKQFGEKVDDTSSKGTSMHNPVTNNTHLIRKKMIELIKKYKDNIVLYHLYGVKADIDFASITKVFGVFDVLNELQLKSVIIFPNKEYQKSFIGIAQKRKKLSNDKKMFLELLKKSIVNQKVYDDFLPDTSPYVVMNFDDGKTKFSQTVSVSKDGKNEIVKMIYHALQYNNIIKQKELNGVNVYDKAIENEKMISDKNNTKYLELLDSLKENTYKSGL